MNISDLRYARFNSAPSRALLSLFYRPGRIYRIPFGPLRGMQLYYDRSVNYHAILGLWDTETLDTLASVLIRSGLITRQSMVIDVGANIGYVTMWMSKYMVPDGNVVAFEPSPGIVGTLRSNIARNNISNVEIIESACGDHTGATDFFVAPHHHRSSLDEAWAAASSDSTAHGERVTVPMTTLDDFLSVRPNRPAFIKIDIEGGGVWALPGCVRTFADCRPLAFIESHTPKEDRAISDVLTGFDYAAYRLDTKAWVARPEATHPDVEGVWGNLLLIPKEKQAAISPLLGAKRVDGEQSGARRVRGAGDAA